MTIISNHQQLLRFTGMVLGTIDTRRNAGYGGPADIDGGDLREQAVACGLLEARTVDSPCRPSCACDRFPVQCYFLTPLGEQAVAETAAPPDDADLPTLASFEGVAPNAVLVDAIGDTTTPAQLLAELDQLRAELAATKTERDKYRTDANENAMADAFVGAMRQMLIDCGTPVAAFVDDHLRNLIIERDEARAELAAVKARAEQADAEATERACRVVCYFCAHPEQWGSAEVISFGNDTPSFMHRSTGSESKYNLLGCAAFMIREAAEKAKAQP